MRQYQRKTIAEAIERHISGESGTSIAKILGCRQYHPKQWYNKLYVNKVATPIIMVKQSKINDERESDRASESGENAERNS